MLWLKAFHLIFVVTWFAGLFYLPRLFIYHAEASEAVVRERFKIMQRRLLGITHIGGLLAVGFGVSLLVWQIRHIEGYMRANPWMHVKLLLVAILIAYHLYLWRLLGQFARDANTRSSRWLRVFNEVPALLLIAIVILAVVRPF